MDYILIAIPFFVLFILVELLYAKFKRKRYYRFNDSITNLNIGIGNQAVGVFVTLLILGVYDIVHNHFAIFHFESGVITFLFGLLVFDFIFYWAHRWSHEVSFFWGAHVVHHSSEEYNLSVALRQPWFHNLIAFFLFLPIPILGIDPLMFAAIGGVHTIYQFWIHTKAIGKLGPLEWIFNTPSHHRVHHGVNKQYIDKNHGGVLIIWDRLFGTFQLEEEEVLYGITNPLKSWNPTWANFHFYADLLRDGTKMRRVSDRMKMWWKKPGWRPESLGGYQSPKGVTPETYHVYDKQTTPRLSRYVFAQFLVLLVGLLAYLSHFETMSWFYRIDFFLVIIATTMICGAIIENKSWVIYAEYARLLLIALSLITFYYYWYADWFIIMLIGAAVGYLLFNFWFTIGWVLLKKKRTAVG